MTFLYKFDLLDIKKKKKKQIVNKNMRNRV